MRRPLALALLLGACVRPPAEPSRANVADELVKAQETCLAQCNSSGLPEGLYWDCINAGHEAQPYLDVVDVTRSNCAFRNAGHALQECVDVLRGYAVPLEDSLTVPVLEAQILGKACQ